VLRKSPGHAENTYWVNVLASGHRPDPCPENTCSASTCEQKHPPHSPHSPRPRNGATGNEGKDGEVSAVSAANRLNSSDAQTVWTARL
jgi:hypothetical protein